MKRKYPIRVVGTATLELDDAVIEGVDDGWRKQFYPLRSADQIAHHIGFNMMVNETSLPEVDGFADRKEEEAKLTDLEWRIDVDD